MRYIIFGTGKLCIRYCRYINIKEVQCFVDNDETKTGKILYEIPVCQTISILKREYDYILVLVKEYVDILKQLVQMGIPIEKIVPYDQLYDRGIIDVAVISGSRKQKISKWQEEHNGPQILVCSPDLSRTGVPVAMMNLILLLKDMKYQVLFAALCEGDLEEELQEQNIDYIPNMRDAYQNTDFIRKFQKFDLIIMGSIILYDLGRALAELAVPIMWWVHESSDEWYTQKLPYNSGNIHYYGGGKRVLKKFHEYYPQESIQELLYYLPDVSSKPKALSNRRKFALIGAFDKTGRKAQDILIQAIKRMAVKTREKCEFYFVGVAWPEKRKEMEQLCRECMQIHYIYQMNQQELADFYGRIDVLVCPSRDDPMPIVVTQAMQHSIPCIVSDQVGQSEYIAKRGGGEIFTSENVEALAELLARFATCSGTEMEQYGKEANEIFEQYFSERIMRENLKAILDGLI